MKKLSVTIIYPFDPLGSKIGGDCNCIKDIISNSPDEINFKLIGVSSKKNLPLGKVSKIKMGKKPVEFLPIMSNEDENKVKSIPLGLKFTYACYARRKEIIRITENSILQFHRIEPFLPFRKTQLKKILFLHRNYADLLNPHCEIRWRHFPLMFKLMEKSALKRSDRVFVRSRDGFEYYKKSMPSKSLAYISQWIDLSLFPDKKTINNSNKKNIFNRLNIDNNDKVIINWGRLAGQKNPFLMLDAFFEAQKKLNNLHLVIIGEGPLKQQMASWIEAKNLHDRIHLLGIKSLTEIIELAQSSDLFILTSAFEAGPISVLEALACGLPVISSDVGLVKEVVMDGITGYLVSDQSPKSFASKIIEIINNQEMFSSSNCKNAVIKFDKKNVLEKIYKTYENMQHKDI